MARLFLLSFLGLVATLAVVSADINKPNILTAVGGPAVERPATAREWAQAFLYEYGQHKIWTVEELIGDYVINWIIQRVKGLRSSTGRNGAASTRRNRRPMLPMRRPRLRMRLRRRGMPSGRGRGRRGAWRSRSGRGRARRARRRNRRNRRRRPRPVQRQRVVSLERTRSLKDINWMKVMQLAMELWEAVKPFFQGRLEPDVVFRSRSLPRRRRWYEDDDDYEVSAIVYPGKEQAAEQAQAEQYGQEQYEEQQSEQFGEQTYNNAEQYAQVYY